MNRKESDLALKSNVKRLFAGPYILWMIGFTIIPLLLIVYYGLTTKSF